MPFTPFHIGPGIAVKASIPRHFSIVVFGLTQIVIDIEVLVYILQGKPHLHRFWHTFFEATIIVIFMTVLGKSASQWIKKLWNKIAGPLQVSVKTTWPASFTGAVIGAYSHIFLDSLFHHDIKPFQPWSSANRLYGVISSSSIATICIILGITGLVALIVRKSLRRKF